MKRLVYLLSAIALLAAACGGTATPATPNAAAPASEDGFRATDPATVELAAGRPQLIEFYAEW